MSERNWSIADRFIHVMAEVQKIDADVDNDNPHRYPLRQLKNVAEKVLHEAITSAGQIADVARVLKKEIEDMDARKQ